MLTPSRATTAATRLAAVPLAVASLLAAPVAATAAEVVGGPGLAAPGVVVHRLAGATPLPPVDADTWLLADITTGEVLAAKGAHTKVLPASTLKTLTAVTLMPKLDKEQVVTATWKQARADGGHVGIVPGATYSVWDLWHGLLLPSANDAAAALADTNGGMAATVREMQAAAIRLQALDTTVRNDSGLDAKGQVSSAYDMALFARAALAIPDFRTITKTFNYSFPGRPVASTAVRKTYKIYTQNRLLVHGYKGVIGGKTGFTSLAHRTFWGAASRGGHTLVVTLFQIHERTETAARKLLDWGFANVGKVAAVGTLVGPADASAPSATAPPTASAVAGNGTTASGGTATDAAASAPWTPIVLVLLLVAAVSGAVLWWRRRRTPYAGSPPDPPLVVDGGLPPRPRPVRPAASTSSSVVVSSPGRPDSPATAPADPPSLDDTAPVPVVPAAPVLPVSVEPGSEPADDGPAPLVPADPAPRPSVGGHVRIITPPGRTPGA